MVKILQYVFRVALSHKLLQDHCTAGMCTGDKDLLTVVVTVTVIYTVGGPKKPNCFRGPQNFVKISAEKQTICQHFL